MNALQKLKDSPRRRSLLLSRLRARQLETALKGKIDASARYAGRAQKMTPKSAGKRQTHLAA